MLPGSDGKAFEPLQKIVDTYDRRVPCKAVTCLAFGDSVSLRVSSSDTDTRRLPQMTEESVREKFQPFNLVDVSFSAFNLRVYRALLEVVHRCRHKPDFILVPVNLRSFSPQWHDNPMWRFEPHLEIIRQRALRRSAPTGPVAPVFEMKDCYATFDQIPIDSGFDQVSTMGDYRRLASEKGLDETAMEKRRAGLLAVHYGLDIPASHPLLNELSKAVALLESMEVPYAFYLTPLNMEAIFRSSPIQTTDRLRANIERVKRTGTAAGTEIRDFSALIDDQGFFYQDLLTEHLSHSGRRKLAAELAALITDDTGFATGRYFN